MCRYQRPDLRLPPNTMLTRDGFDVKGNAQSHLDAEGSTRRGVADVTIRNHVDPKANNRTVDGGDDRERTPLGRADRILKI